MKVGNVISPNDLSLAPWRTVREAAAIMRDRDVAALPVMVDGLPVGIVTDRDIVVRLLPESGDAGA